MPKVLFFENKDREENRTSVFKPIWIKYGKSNLSTTNIHQNMESP